MEIVFQHVRAPHFQLSIMKFRYYTQRKKQYILSLQMFGRVWMEKKVRLYNIVILESFLCVPLVGWFPRSFHSSIHDLVICISLVKCGEDKKLTISQGYLRTELENAWKAFSTWQCSMKTNFLNYTELFPLIYLLIQNLFIVVKVGK